MLVNNNKLQIPLLLVLMLNACGGGSGDTNVSSSPNPPLSNNGGSNGNTGGTGNTGNTGSGPGNSAPDTPAPDSGNTEGNSGGSTGGSTGGNTGGSQSPGNTTPPATSNTAGPPTQVPPTTARSSRWVSGDVLATMLTQQTRTTNSIDNLSDAFPMRAAVPWSGPGPGGQAKRNASAPNIHAHQSLLFQPHTPGRISYQASNFWRLNTDSNATFNFSALSLSLDLIVSLPYYRQNANEIQFDRSGPITTGTELLSIRDTIETTVITETLAGRQPGEQKLTLGNGGIYSIRQGVQVPYNQVLMRWSADNTTLTEMLLLKGIDDSQARLCFNIHLPGLKRLACTIWTIPAGWQLGQRLAFKGNYIVDDQSAQPGGNGILYWQTPAW